MSDFVAGILFIFIITGLVLVGYSFKETYVNDDILKNRSIYIKDVEYKCKEVK